MGTKAMGELRRGGRPYDPREVIFAPTARCNLSCAHCRAYRGNINAARKAARSAARLPISAALTFLEDCAANGIERVGFSGGEPFLEVDFLEAIIVRAVELDLMFDRLMTNGDWWGSEGELTETLGQVIDAGFDGTVGISFDDWHAQDPKRLAQFTRATRELSSGSVAVEIVAVRDRAGKMPIDRISALARELGARIVSECGDLIAIRDETADRNASRGAEDGTGIDIPLLFLPYSPGPNEADAWAADRWFDDDWCEGPGHVLFVHPDGNVAVCCGFANERPELIAGNISAGVAALVERARAMPHVRACYERGLGAVRKELESRGIALPGKTADICQFCDWLCEKGLAISSCLT